MNIITNLANGVGLQRDYEVIAPKLRAMGWEVLGVQFDVTHYIENADVNLFLEVNVPRLYRYAREQWFVPNAEWCPTSALPELKANFSRVLCKTHDAHRIFNRLFAGTGVAVLHTGWESRDLYAADIPREWKFLHVPGKSQNKNTGAILQAWRSGRIPYQLTLVSEYFPEAAHIPNVTRMNRVSDEELQRLMNIHQFHLCPSEYEGWGHYLHEAMGVGAVVLTTDAPPMNESGAPQELLIPVSNRQERYCAVMNTVLSEGVLASVTRATQWSPEQVQSVAAAARESFLLEREYFNGQFATAFRLGTVPTHATPRPAPVFVPAPPGPPTPDIVLIPTYYRPEYLWLCLEHLAAAEGGCDKEIWISHDRHVNDAPQLRNEDALTRRVIENFHGAFAALRYVEREKHSFEGNSYNVLEMYREAYASAARLIYLVEDDVMVAPDFFRWHESVQQRGIAQNGTTYLCSVGWHCIRNAAVKPSQDPTEYIESCMDYASIGVCWQRENLDALVTHARPEYYSSPKAYSLSAFSNRGLERFTDFTEQDGLVQRILLSGRREYVAWPSLARCAHVGVNGYHRQHGYRFTGTLEQRIHNLRRAVTDNTRLLSLVNDPFKNVSALTVIPEWRAEDLRVVLRLPHALPPLEDVRPVPAPEPPPKPLPEAVRIIQARVREPREREWSYSGRSRVLVLVKSCQSRRAFRASQRSTWLSELPSEVDYRFFIGGNVPADEPDVVGMNVLDDYNNVALKLKAAFQWAYNRGYNFVFVCDDDTYVRPERLLASGFEETEYTGLVRVANAVGSRPYNDGISYIQGAAYWLSRRAVGTVLESDAMVGDHIDDGAVGKALCGKVPLVNDTRYEPGPHWNKRYPMRENDVISTHKCSPEQMLEVHRLWKAHA